MPNIQIANNCSLTIFTTKVRTQKTYTKEETDWQEFLNRVNNPIRTSEAHKDYMASSKDTQSAIKDIGGFVGGELKDGKRSKESVINRSVIALDADFAPDNFGATLSNKFKHAYCIYSTHKHCSESPRYRLIVPLNRSVSPREYEAIALWVANQLGLEYFDPTSFQPERLMYWPSTSKDGEFVFQYNDAPMLDADNVLNSYDDWQDETQWPVHPVNVKNKAQKGNSHKQDPNKLPHNIGAFNRAYPISDAIEKFLSDVYEPLGIGTGRYTYSEGSTAGGLVVYNDQFAFSHHASDPACNGHAHNAFDLVRIHKFGSLDKDDRKAISNQKSQEKMLEIIATDEKLLKEKEQEALERFKNFGHTNSQELDVAELIEKLQKDKKGNILDTNSNFGLILGNDPQLAKRFAMDLFACRPVILLPLPGDPPGIKYPRWETDDDTQIARSYIDTFWGIRHKDRLNEELTIERKANAFHPIRDWLSNILWDGQKRLESVLIDYLGAQDNEFVRTVTRKQFVGAVSRIFNPGCKYDYILVLIGEQGGRKSSILRRMAGDEYFTDDLSFSHIDGGKSAAEKLKGKWLVEVAEMAGGKKADIEQSKAFITRQADHYRPAYGRLTETYPRQCVFFGSANDVTFLSDSTGNRRYWPVVTSVANKNKELESLTEEVREQIWAEAVELYKKGEPLYLSSEMEEIARVHQREHTIEDERMGLIEEYLNTPLPDGWDKLKTNEKRCYYSDIAQGVLKPGVNRREFVSVQEIWCECFGNLPKTIDKLNTNQLHGIMRMMPNWTRLQKKMRRGDYGAITIYQRKEK